MFMPRRRKDQLIAKILEICQHPGMVKTRIVYQANMNFKSADPYMDQLTRMGLLEVAPGTYSIYKTTPKGKSTLEALRKIEKNIPEFID
jgi:predicted transcriptional regulator